MLMSFSFSYLILLTFFQQKGLSEVVTTELSTAFDVSVFDFKSLCPIPNSVKGDLEQLSAQFALISGPS